MKHTYSIVGLIGFVAVLTFWTALAFAQPGTPQSEPVFQSQGAPSDSGAGTGMMNGGGMMGGQGMMGGKQMMRMPIMPGCPYGMMGTMMDTSKDLKTAARMMEMNADMMKASAAIMEKYANSMDSGK